MLDPHLQGFAKLTAMIEALDVGMLTTGDENGTLRSRPMATQRAEKGALYFFTSEDSPKVDELHKISSVNVSYADPNNQIYVSVSGDASASHDSSKIRELWTEGARRWFPEGPDDPRIALLKVEVTKAEYWDVDTKSMAALLNRGAPASEVIAAVDHKKLG